MRGQSLVVVVLVFVLVWVAVMVVVLTRRTVIYCEHLERRNANRRLDWSRTSQSLGPRVFACREEGFCKPPWIRQSQLERRQSDTNSSVVVVVFRCCPFVLPAELLSRWSCCHGSTQHFLAELTSPVCPPTPPPPPRAPALISCLLALSSLSSCRCCARVSRGPFVGGVRCTTSSSP